MGNCIEIAIAFLIKFQGYSGVSRQFPVDASVDPHYEFPYRVL